MSAFSGSRKPCGVYQLWVKDFEEMAVRALLCLLSIVSATAVSGQTTRPAIAKPKPNQAKPVPLKGVKTLADLQAQPVIRIGSGQKVRLGISADRVPLGGGVLVYCLWEGTSWKHWPKSGWQPMSMSRFLGPMRVCWTDGNRRTGGRIFVTPHPKKAPPSPSLWMTLVPVTTEGRRRLAVYVHDRAIIAPITWEDFDRPGLSVHDGSALSPIAAAATVHGTRPAAQAWTVLLPSHWNLHGAGSPEALPQFSGLQWVPIDTLNKGRLPGILPEKEGSLRVEIEGDRLTLSADQDINSRPDRYTLLRFWVNGKPVPWSARRLFLCDAGIEYPLRKITGKIRWPDLVPGLKRGDRLRVQALFCYGGWWNTADDGLFPSRIGDWQSVKPSLLSKPVRFTYQPPKSATQPATRRTESPRPGLSP